MKDRIVVDIQPPNPIPGTCVRLKLRRVMSEPLAPRPDALARSQSAPWDAAVLVDPCPICAVDEDPAGFRAAYRLQCGHAYHPMCLAQWARQHQSCPECREKFDGGQWTHLLQGPAGPPQPLHMERESPNDNASKSCCLLSMIIGIVLGGYINPTFFPNCSYGVSLSTACIIPCCVWSVTQLCLWRYDNH